MVKASRGAGQFIYMTDKSDEELCEIAKQNILASRNKQLDNVKWHTEFGHLNRGDMLTSEQHRCSNEKKKF